MYNINNVSLSISPPPLFQGDVWDLYHEIATYLLQATTTNVFSKRHHNKSLTAQHKLTSQPSPVRSASSQIFQVLIYYINYSLIIH